MPAAVCRLLPRTIRHALTAVVIPCLLMTLTAIPASIATPAAAAAEDASKPAEQPIVLYCGRSTSLVGPVIEQFTKATGIKVQVRAAKTAQLALALQEEGARSPADVFWAQDAGTLGALTAGGHFTALPTQTLEKVPSSYRNSQGHWVGTSGRVRVLAYSPDRVKADDLPASVFDLTDPKYKGRVGWAPTNASFQAFVTGMRLTHGQEKTRTWLEAMKANGTRPFPKNTAIITGIANGEIDLGLPNHYYLLRFKTSDSKYPVEQTQFAKGDIGNMNNVAGVALVRTSRNKAAAIELINYLLSAQAQQYFVGETFELPVTDDVIAPGKLIDPQAVKANLPQINLDDLKDLQATQELLREVGLI